MNISEETYIKEINKFYDRGHKIYIENIELLNRKNHEKNAYYLELSIRDEAIKELEIDINKPFFDEKSALKDIEKATTKAKEYLYYIYSAQKWRYKKNDDNQFEIKPLSMHELLKIRHLLTKNQYDLITNYNGDYNLAILKCLYDIDDKQHLYYNIWNDIYDYFLNSQEEFINYCKNAYGMAIKNKNRYSSHVLAIIDDIFLDVEKVIEYLDKSNNLDKYRTELISCFKYNEPTSTIQDISQNDNISNYYYPNKVINFKIDLNNSYKEIIYEIKMLQEEFEKKELLNLDLLHKKETLSIKHETDIIRSKGIPINIYDKLFLFDATLFGLKSDTVAPDLHYYVDNSKYSLPDKKTIEKHVNDVKEMLTNQNYIQHAVGISKDSLL
ncbi:MAG: hypothetical protein WC272_05630 [Sulfurimonas sp.]|jgi:hypothetical protein